MVSMVATVADSAISLKEFSASGSVIELVIGPIVNSVN